jgi:hypothetical protein
MGLVGHSTKQHGQHKNAQQYLVVNVEFHGAP